MEQDFSECVIIPIKLFSQCSFEKDGQHVAILDNPKLDPDLKLKLYNQQQHYEKLKTLEPEKESPVDLNQYLNEFPVAKRPVAKNIFEMIMLHPKLVSWDPYLQVTINGIFYPQSNILNMIRYVLGELIMTKETDVPQGIDQFVSVLHDIGVPTQWFSIKRVQKARTGTRRHLPTPPRTRSKKKKEQEQMSDEDLSDSLQFGTGWIVL
jgi:hypothetical protein